MKTIAIIIAIFISTMAFGQQKNESHYENHSIQIKYSMSISPEEFSEVCEIISETYPEFDCASERNPIYEVESEKEYLRISIRREKRIKMVLKTTNAENENIEKFHELNKNLDKY